MDLTKIKSAILNQLTDTNSLYSLKLQNHLYGCFIIMEDLAQDRVTLSDMVLSTPKYKFDLDKQFHMIGIRYGFIMDTQLAFDKFSPEYHDVWIDFFKRVYSTKDLTEVDRIEDYIIEVVQGAFVRAQDDAFFINALETGSLPQEWIERVLGLINGTATTNTNAAATTNTNATTTTNATTNTNTNAVATTTVIDSYTTNMPVTDSSITTNTTIEKAVEKASSDEEVHTNAITRAIVEKPIRSRRHLAITRKTNGKPDSKKKNLAKTRRR